ncbi:hypothetical protein [Agromyces indicus]|uniref:Protein NO VEIN C-terminal domain-containing protein n=1 Tax=Agromyces indicus TaxID=758919 RepID=A0ABU1FLW9_9MICO|nr:hypothetical protein [Agromyces indicus]MDR5692750.1 hypothetical protein [Agromyces indicus]
MYFSEAFGIPAGETPHDWFDPLMEIDTPLFVDPFLIYREDAGQWTGAADALAGHFELGFSILAGHQANPRSQQYKKTVDLMLFPEPREFGLGVASTGTAGSGTGRGFAERIVGAMALAIENGLQDLHHFEELGLLVERIGRDRISDITCNVLKRRFIEYTQEVARTHDVPLEIHRVANAALDPYRKRWVPEDHDLPTNPVTGGPVLLTPKRFLRELPTLNADDWWNYVEPELREDLNLDIGSRLPKARIVALARSHPHLVRQWSAARESFNAKPYDVERDPEGLHNWQRETAKVSEDLPIDFPSVDEENLNDFIRKVNERFRHFVEEQGGWRLLRNDDTNSPKRETSIQLLYKGVVESYCKAHQVHLDREVELGRGPVDFIFTASTQRVLMEVKKLRNGKFWNGLEDQLVSYLTSAECSAGWFVAVRLGNTPTELSRVAALPTRTRTASERTGFELRSVLVDARIHLSASLLDGEGDGTVEGPDDDEEGLD